MDISWKTTLHLRFAYSPKTARDWILSSGDEYYYAVSLDASPDVVSFELAPEEIIVKVSNENHITKFDAIVRYQNKGPEACEVKTLAINSHDDQRSNQSPGANA